MITGEIRKELKKLQDKGYREMQVTIIPTLEADSIIGVRTPALRQLAKEFAKREDISEFLSDLPHKFFEENQLHAFILSGMKDAESCIRLVDEFLPYVDNWATCDQMSPKVFKKHKQLLLEYVDKWIRSEHTYVKRFAIGMLMEHFVPAAELESVVDRLGTHDEIGELVTSTVPCSTCEVTMMGNGAVTYFSVYPVEAAE